MKKAKKVTKKTQSDTRNLCRGDKWLKFSIKQIKNKVWMLYSVILILKANNSSLNRGHDWLCKNFHFWIHGWNKSREINFRRPEMNAKINFRCVASFPLDFIVWVCVISKWDWFDFVSYFEVRKGNNLNKEKFRNKRKS